jgi:phosphatidate phosphatase
VVGVVKIILKFPFLITQDFVCSDPKLSFPKKPDTVKNWMLDYYSLSQIVIVSEKLLKFIAISHFVIYIEIQLLVCEILFNCKHSKGIVDCLKKSWNNATYVGFRYYLDFYLMNIFMLVVKFWTGSQRPHFFESCMPDKMFNCTPGMVVSNWKCSNPTEPYPAAFLETSMSFFSGHAAISVFSCTFTCWYLQRRSKGTSVFLVPFFQTLLICLAYFVSISRVTDNRHHWWDVMIGMVVGILGTYHAVRKKYFGKPS